MYPFPAPHAEDSRGVTIVPQGEYVASSLQNYLKRHPEMDSKLTRGGTVRYLTTENEQKFKDSASIFLHEQIEATHVELLPFEGINDHLICKKHDKTR